MLCVMDVMVCNIVIELEINSLPDREADEADEARRLPLGCT